MTSKLSLSYKDHDRELGSVGFRFVLLTAANFDATNTLMDNLITAVTAVQTGVLEVETRIALRDDNNALPPADPFAQRETKWLVRARDSAGDAVQFEIPCADLSLLVLNSSNMDITAGDGLALVTAIEAGVLSKAGLAITVDEVIHVGRNI